MSRSRVVTFLLLLSVASAGMAGDAPIAVSPGHPSRLVALEGRCPTFSWGEVRGVKAYELAVFRIEMGETGDIRRVIRELVDGGALSWTPSADRCLERGRAYAWMVRTVGRRGVSEWSEPKLMQVGSGPASRAVERAISILREDLAAATRVEGSQPGIGPEVKRVGTANTVELSGVAAPNLGAGGVAISGQEITINGNLVVTTVTDQDTLGDLLCTVDEIAVKTESGWECGVVPCPSGLISCQGKCVNTTSDESNCGACEASCSSGELCQGGSCNLTCQSGLTNCSGICVNTMSDEASCGDCSTSCATGEACQSGSCALSCQSELTDCSGICVDTVLDELNCGSCGSTCAFGEVCEAGSCAPEECPVGKTLCAGFCLDLRTDLDNCGGCGNVCAVGESCEGGSCVPE